MSSPTRRTSRIKATAVLFSAAMILVVSGPGTQGASADEPTADDSVPSTGDAGSGAGQFQELYDEVASLEGEEALAFFESLPERGVSGPAVIDFFIDLPISQANEQIYDLFEEEGFEGYMDGLSPWRAVRGVPVGAGFGHRDRRAVQRTGPEASLHRLRTAGRAGRSATLTRPTRSGSRSTVSATRG